MAVTLMKIAMYLENKNISSVDLRFPEQGNPGVGGTEFNFITLASELQNRYHFLKIKMFAQATQLLPENVACQQAFSCVKAVELAISQGFEFFVWRPTVREDASQLVNNISSYAIKFIIWAHNTPESEILSKLAIAENVRRFVPVGHYQKRAIQSAEIRKKTTAIHNGFHFKAYQGTAEKDPNLVVYTGSIIPVKGFGLLAKAWPKVIQQCPNAKLVVIGSGQLYNRNAKLGPWRIADADFENSAIIPYLSDENGKLISSVIFKGVMGAEKIPLLKQAICGVVNPTGKGENCPGSAIEFLAAGTAVVSAASEGILDVVDDGITGILGHGVDELAVNITLMLKETEYAVKLGNSGPDIIQTRFNYDKICDEWMTLFAEEQSFQSLNDNYFLPISKTELKHDIAIRRGLANLPINDQFQLYSHLTQLISNRRSLSIKQKNEGWEVTTNGKCFNFPTGIPSVKLLMCSFDYANWLQRKYTLPGFVELNGGDTVLDCGAFVGGFAYAAAELGCKVICVEPDSNNCEFVEKNTKQFEAVLVECAGLHENVGNMVMNMVDNPVEHSMLTPDAGNPIESRTVPVFTIDAIAQKHKIDKFDFAKIEAEGVELEILRGMQTLHISKLAVDCSPERNGESPMQEIKTLLKLKGYQTISRGWILFARKQNDK
jgi:FkbM family methyltransferase